MNNTKVFLIFVLVISLLMNGILGFQWWRANKENKTLKDQNSSVCTKDNSCKFRTPGSAFRCDKNGKYKSNGDYWCECTIDCEVVIR